MALKKEYREQLLIIIDKYLPECRVYLFGSRAVDKEGVGSDIDLALDAGSPISFDTIIAMLVEIDGTTIPMKVDLVDFQLASEKLKKEIIKKGIRWTD